MHQLSTLSSLISSQSMKLLAVSIISVAVGLCGVFAAQLYIFPPQSPPSSVNQVIVTVSYGGQWIGVYGHCQVGSGEWESAYTSLRTTTWEGNDSKAETLTRPVEPGDNMWIIVANALKCDSTSNQLAVRITKSDGTILGEASNSSSYGFVQVSYYFHGDQGQAFEYSGSSLVPRTTRNVVLVVENVTYYAVDSTNNRAEVILRNTGNGSDQIVDVYWSDSSFSNLVQLNKDEYTLSPSMVYPESSISIIIKWGVSGGSIMDSEWDWCSSYYFKVITEDGRYLEFSEGTPIAGNELLSFLSVDFQSETNVQVKLKNIGTATFTIDEIMINDNLNTTTPGWSVGTGESRTLDANEEATVTVDASKYAFGSFTEGDNYAFIVVTALDNKFGPYTKAASW